MKEITCTTKPQNELEIKSAQKPLSLSNLAQSGLGKTLRKMAIGAAIAGGDFKSNAAITFAADQPLALSLGADFASQDLIRATLFTNNDTGATFRGNAMPLGPYYSGISYHWITALQGYWGTSNSSISVGTGTDRTNPTQSTPILSLDRIPGQDFAILQQQSALIGLGFKCEVQHMENGE